MLDDLGEGHDAKVQQWHDNLKGFILSQLVSRIISIMFCVYICIVCLHLYSVCTCGETCTYPCKHVGYPKNLLFINRLHWPLEYMCQ